MAIFFHRNQSIFLSIHSHAFLILYEYVGICCKCVPQKNSFIQLLQVGNCGIMGSIIYLFTLQQLLWLQRTDYWSLIDHRFYIH